MKCLLVNIAETSHRYECDVVSNFHWLRVKHVEHSVQNLIDKSSIFQNIMRFLIPLYLIENPNDYISQLFHIFWPQAYFPVDVEE